MMIMVGYTKLLIPKLLNIFAVTCSEFHIYNFHFCTFFQTSRPEFEGSEFSVRRRYNDFLWIRQRLEEKHPTHLVPVGILKKKV